MKLITLLMLILLVGCGIKQVRYDPNPSPIDVNYYTLPIEACGNLAFGQGGCSYGYDEEISDGDELVIYTPLGGNLSITSRECGVDKTIFAKQAGRYSWKVRELFPDKGVRFCSYRIYITWELPEGFESEYKVRGSMGEFYVRRRSEKYTSASMIWSPQADVLGSFDGISFVQFRGYVNPIVNTIKYDRSREPVLLTIKLDEDIKTGLYGLKGCGHGVDMVQFSGDKIEIERPDIIGEKPTKTGTCVMYGYAIDGFDNFSDFVVGYNIFGWNNRMLAVDAWIDDSKICYVAENTVTLSAYNDEVSNELEGCFSLVDKDSYIAWFTHVGRMAYAFVTKEKEIKWIR